MMDLKLIFREFFIFIFSIVSLSYVYSGVKCKVSSVVVGSYFLDRGLCNFISSLLPCDFGVLSFF